MCLASSRLLVSSFLVLVAGCGVMVPLSPDYEEPPPGPCAALSCEPGTHCVDGECVADDRCAGVECAEGRVCLDGECVPEVLDEDGDGYPARSDCDDHDADVYPGQRRPCQTRCGEGFEVCQGPAWDACSAPIDCACQPGEERPEPCGNCGEARRRCTPEGTWAELPGPCEGSRDCQPGVDSQEPCSHCGTRVRTCDLDCRWGDWSDCEVGGECSPGDVEQLDCGPCGLGTTDHFCEETCFWGPRGSCELDATVCVPGLVKEEACDDCGLVSQTCTDACEWSDVSVCENQGCELGETESRQCPCGGAETRVCEDAGCFGPWSGCATDDRRCLDVGEVLSCANGCGTTTCSDFCLEDCTVRCSCQANDGTVYCPGDVWTEPDACGLGVDIQYTCTDAGQGPCLPVGVCPADL